MKRWSKTTACTMGLLLWACGGDDAGTSAESTRADAGQRADGGALICTKSGDCEQAIEVGAPQHISGDIAYEDTPPAGGPHNPCWAGYGVHDEPVRAENWVHNLEHGAVVYLYHCPEGCEDEVAALRALVEDRPFALLTPYDAMRTRFAVVAWGVRLQSDELDRNAFRAFYDAHVDHALESTSSDPPSSCL